MSTPRPRSVTLGCVYGGLGGLLTTVVLFETLQGWGSIEMQESLRAGLEQVGADVDLASILPALRWVVMGLLVAAIAATVFAFYAARGHQASRIGLSVLAGGAALTFVLSGLAGLLPAVLSALVVYLLWSAPAREWYAVVNGRTPLSLGTAPSVPTSVPHAQAPSTAEAPHRQSTAVAETPRPPAYDPAQYPQHGPVASARPRAVTIAFAVAWAGHALGAALSGLVLLVLVALRDEVVAQYESNDVLAGQLRQAGVSAEQMVNLGAGLFGAWTVISLVGLAVTAWAATRRPSGRWALVVMSVVAAGAAAFGLPMGLVWMIGAIVVIVQLSKPEAKAWFRRA